MDSFYVTLPSNVIDHERKNTASNFRTLLPSTIDLEGEWSVALVEMHYPASWLTMYDQYVSVFFQHKEPGATNVGKGISAMIRVPEKNYKNVNNLLETINDKITSELMLMVNAASDVKRDISQLQFLKEVVRFEYDNKMDHVILRVFPTKLVQIFITKLLAYTLGFVSKAEDGEINFLETSEATYPPDLTAGLNSMYIYCDAVEPQIIGNTRAPLLRVVPLSYQSFGKTICERFVDPHYVPVVARQLQSLLISINTDQNKPMPFSFGKSIIKLHFKRKK